MAFTSIPTSMIQVGKALVQSLMQYIKDNFDYLYGKLDAIDEGSILNGSMELDTDLDGEPNSWTVSTYSGGKYGRCPSFALGTDDLPYRCISDHTAAAANKPITGASYATYWEQTGSTSEAPAWVDSSEYRANLGAHGRFGFFFVHPGGVGNGGGYADSDYIAVDQLRGYMLTWLHMASAAGMKNQVIVRYFDKDKVYISAETLYDSTSNPTSYTEKKGYFVPASTARFVTIRVVGGESSVNVAGTAYFDGIQLNDGGGRYISFSVELPEVTSASTSYTDFISFRLVIPCGCKQIAMYVLGGGNGTGAFSNKARLKEGSNYSNEVDILNSATYARSPIMKLDVAAVAGTTVTITIQGKCGADSTLAKIKRENDSGSGIYGIEVESFFIMSNN